MVFKKELLSIVIPVYQKEDTIEGCLREVLSQTYENIEIIIIYLDGSDKTRDVINSIKDDRITIIEQKDRTGPGGARNIGINHATGKYIGFVEADDVIAADFYHKLIHRIETDKTDIAWGEIIFNASGEVKKWVSHAQDKVICGFPEAYQLIVNGASFDKIYHLSFLRKHSIRFQECVRWEDNPFILKAFYHAKKISLVKEALYYYSPSPWDEDYRKILTRDIMPVVVEMINFTKKHAISSSEVHLIKRKIISCFVGNFIIKNPLYEKILHIMDYPLFLRIFYFKKKLKALGRNLFKRKGKNLCLKKH